MRHKISETFADPCRNVRIKPMKRKVNGFKGKSIEKIIPEDETEVLEHTNPKDFMNVDLEHSQNGDDSFDDREMWNEMFDNININLCNEINEAIAKLESNPLFKAQEEETCISSNLSTTQDVQNIKSFPQLAEEYLVQQGLPFYVDEETPADGNCFYFALLTKVKACSSIWEEALLKMEMDPDDILADYYVQNLSMPSLKQIIIDYMYKFQVDNIVCEVGVCPNSCGDGLEHLMYLEQMNVWADEFVIQATTALLDSRICLIYPTGKIERYTWSDRWNKDIYMFYFPKAHFQSVTPSLPEEELRNFVGTESDHGTDSWTLTNTDFSIQLPMATVPPAEAEEDHGITNLLADGKIDSYDNSNLKVETGNNFLEESNEEDAEVEEFLALAKDAINRFEDSYDVESHEFAFDTESTPKIKPNTTFMEQERKCSDSEEQLPEIIDNSNLIECKVIANEVEEENSVDSR